MASAPAAKAAHAAIPRTASQADRLTAFGASPHKACTTTAMTTGLMP